MDERKKVMLEKLKPERHISAMMTLATIKFIKEECRKNVRCTDCRFYNEKNPRWKLCYICGRDEYPSEWDEYNLTERIYK